MTDNLPDPPDDPKPSGSWLPSPGCLFVVTLLVILGALCLTIGWPMHRRQAGIEYLQQLGVQFQSEPARPVWLHDRVVAQWGTEHAAGFTDVTWIVFDGYQVTEAGLQHLNGLNNLRGLSLANTEVTDVSLRHLSGLANLQVLSLHNTPVTGTGLQYLSNLGNLRELYLSNTQVADADLQHLSGLSNLDVLWLRNTRVTDAGVDSLRSQLPGVRILH